MSLISPRSHFSESSLTLLPSPRHQQTPSQSSPSNANIDPQSQANQWGAAGKLKALSRSIFERAYGLNGRAREDHAVLCEEVMAATHCSAKSFEELVYGHSYDSELHDLRAQVPDYKPKEAKKRTTAGKSMKTKSLGGSGAQTPTSHSHSLAAMGRNGLGLMVPNNSSMFGFGHSQSMVSTPASASRFELMFGSGSHMQPARRKSLDANMLHTQQHLPFNNGGQSSFAFQPYHSHHHSHHHSISTLPNSQALPPAMIHPSSNSSLSSPSSHLISSSQMHAYPPLLSSESDMVHFPAPHSQPHATLRHRANFSSAAAAAQEAANSVVQYVASTPTASSSATSQWSASVTVSASTSPTNAAAATASKDSQVIHPVLTLTVPSNSSRPVSAVSSPSHSAAAALAPSTTLAPVTLASIKSSSSSQQLTNKPGSASTTTASSSMPLVARSLQSQSSHATVSDRTNDSSSAPVSRSPSPSPHPLDLPGPARPNAIDIPSSPKQEHEQEADDPERTSAGESHSSSPPTKSTTSDAVAQSHSPAIPTVSSAGGTAASQSAQLQLQSQHHHRSSSPISARAPASVLASKPAPLITEARAESRKSNKSKQNPHQVGHDSHSHSDNDSGIEHTRASAGTRERNSRNVVTSTVTAASAVHAAVTLPSPPAFIDFSAMMRQDAWTPPAAASAKSTSTVRAFLDSRVLLTVGVLTLIRIYLSTAFGNDIHPIDANYSLTFYALSTAIAFLLTVMTITQQHKRMNSLATIASRLLFSLLKYSNIWESFVHSHAHLSSATATGALKSASQIGLSAYHAMTTQALPRSLSAAAVDKSQSLTLLTHAQDLGHFLSDVQRAMLRNATTTSTTNVSTSVAGSTIDSIRRLDHSLTRIQTALLDCQAWIVDPSSAARASTIITTSVPSLSLIGPSLALPTLVLCLLAYLCLPIHAAPWSLLALMVHLVLPALFTVLLLTLLLHATLTPETMGADAGTYAWLSLSLGMQKLEARTAAATTITTTTTE